MYCKFRAIPGVAIAILTLASCVKSPAPTQAQRIAVLRFENLSPDGTRAWVGRGLSEVVTAQLGGAAVSSARLHSFDRVLGPRPISSPGVSAESTQAILAGATRVVYGDYTVRNNRLEVQVTVEDPGARRIAETFTVTTAAGDVVGAAEQIARHLNPKLTPFPTRNEAALAGYIRALESGDANRMEQELNAAIEADPDFPAPYRLLAQERVQRGDRAGAAKVVEQALSRGDRIPALDRARFEVQDAEITGDPNARLAAMLKLVKLDTTDPILFRALGESLMSRHEYKRAAESLQKSAELEPGEAATWNLLGYASAYAGNLAEATTALKRYESLQPNSANPLDSLGDVYFSSGKLADAVQFYQQSFQKEPNFNNQGSLLKAAVAQLYAGDLTAADQAAERYFDVRAKAKDPILDYRKAQWLWLTGHRRQAIPQMQAFVKATQDTQLRDSAARALSEMALWSLETGDRAAATQLATKSAQIANPPARGNGIVAAFLALPPASASEWSVRAEQQFGGPEQTSIRNFALSYALLVNKEFQPAQLLLKQMWESGTPISDEGLPVMLAWTMIETGNFKDAAPLLRFNPVPNANGLTLYSSFYLPRLFYLRGKLAEKEGRGSDAAAEFKRFSLLSGDLPLMWGEEKSAK